MMAWATVLYNMQPVTLRFIDGRFRGILMGQDRWAKLDEFYSNPSKPSDLLFTSLPLGMCVYPGRYRLKGGLFAHSRVPSALVPGQTVFVSTLRESVNSGFLPSEERFREFASVVSLEWTSECPVPVVVQELHPSMVHPDSNYSQV
jgi:hypothetical protein